MQCPESATQATPATGNMQAHPLAEQYPEMDAVTFAAFKADIEANGCREPIILFEDKILDGRNRFRACGELGIKPVFKEFNGTVEDAEAAVDSYNLHRRHLTAQFRKKRVQQLRADGKSLREIAETVRIDKRQVQRDLAQTEVVTEAPPEPPEVGTLSPPEPQEGSSPQDADQEATPTTEPPPPSGPSPSPAKVTGRDGKKYPATRRPKQATKTAPAANPEARPNKPITASDVSRQIEQLLSLIRYIYSSEDSDDRSRLRAAFEYQFEEVVKKVRDSKRRVMRRFSQSTAHKTVDQERVEGQNDTTPGISPGS
jgi:hypothetical protein